jgi:hypothetical protein
LKKTGATGKERPDAWIATQVKVGRPQQRTLAGAPTSVRTGLRPVEALRRGVHADGGRRRRTALSAYLIGNVINAAYVDKNLPGIIVLALVTAVLFLVKALATYGHTVMLSRIGNRIIALNQRQMFNALINQNVAFFSERHSSEFMARLTTGCHCRQARSSTCWSPRSAATCSRCSGSWR